MLKTLKIDCFRGIRNLSVSSLNRINLVVGDNNSGKTSVLEALELLRSPAQGSLANIYRTARQRESMSGLSANSIYDSFLCMFPHPGEDLLISLSADTDVGRISFRITGKESKILLDSSELDRNTRRQLEDEGAGPETYVFNGVVEYIDGNSAERENIRLDRYSRISGTAVISNDRIPIVYVSPFEHLRGNIINLIVKNDEYKRICLKSLQLFDPDIMDMMIFRSDTGNRPVEYLRHRKLGNMPLSTYGDGIKKVLALSNAVAFATGGILLIDEIETAIHKKYYDDIFRFIVKASKTFNVQVFITTHSLEAIDGLLATQDYNEQNSSDDITVMTLKKEDERTLSRVLSGRQVFRNREDYDFEVRL